MKACPVQFSSNQKTSGNAGPRSLKPNALSLDFQNAGRIQDSFVAAAERKSLLWLAAHTPEWINPDHLTLLGFVSQVMAGASYAFARWNPAWLLACIGFLALNWLGDSLDGTLARFREKQRPRYGFYVDHMMDSVGGTCLMCGLALSGYMDRYVAMGLLVFFLLLSIQSYLATYTLKEFRLSFWRFGPTELRILLCLGNLAVLRWPRVLKPHYRLFDLGGVIGIAGMAGMFVFYTAQNLLRLYREERIS